MADKDLTVEQIDALWSGDASSLSNEEWNTLCDMARRFATEIEPLQNERNEWHARSVESTMRADKIETDKLILADQLATATAQVEQMREALRLVDVFNSGHMIYDAVTNHPEYPQRTLRMEVKEALDA